MKPYELIDALMKRDKIGDSALARKLGRMNLQPPINRFRKGNVPQPDITTAKPIATHFGIPVEAMYDERVATEVARSLGLVGGESSTPAERPTRELPVAHGLSDSSIKIPQTMRWGELQMMKELPEVFDVELEDDAMAPSFPAGIVVRFERRSDPSFGNRVLIRDVKGALHFRTYAQSATEAWQGATTNPIAFRDLMPLRDGAQVVAVKTGHFTPGA